GPWTRVPGQSSRNTILWKEKNGYKNERLPGFAGETLSILISDINQDGFPDLLVGNDFEIPESYYFGQPGGKLKLVKRSDNIFPETTFSTMSIDSGDMDNDLEFEVYTSQASGFTSTNPTNRASMLPLQTIFDTCDEYENNVWRTECLSRVKQHAIIFDARMKRNPRRCLDLEGDSEIRGCLAHLLLIKSTRLDSEPKICARLERNWEDFARICKLGFQEIPKYGRAQVSETLRQRLGRNMLYKRNDAGAYSELAEEMDADITGWSWTSKFADLDNDEWQDLYIVNGRYASQKRATNVFFRNENGKRFSNSTREAGLENYLAMNSYTLIDFDNDADLDIVAVSLQGPIWLYVNNTQHNAGIVFELDDKKANRAGIGSRIIIHYGASGSKHQIREIKASGGFLSYDAPQAHFGLGEHGVISRVEVIWSTGEITELTGEFRAGHKYRIERTST
ncbi:MAG: CRTAC1 family protein, partial [Gammaproteobacteria bacterium]|nr:CRTAC1 family protein [Gammaproteobacteria bacterium]